MEIVFFRTLFGSRSMSQNFAQVVEDVKLLSPAEKEELHRAS